MKPTLLHPLRSLAWVGCLLALAALSARAQQTPPVAQRVDINFGQPKLLTLDRPVDSFSVTPDNIVKVDEGRRLAQRAFDHRPRRRQRHADGQERRPHAALRSRGQPGARAALHQPQRVQAADLPQPDRRHQPLASRASSRSSSPTRPTTSCWSRPTRRARPR